jgi:hypothetical protein
MPIQVYEVSRAPKRHDQNLSSPQHIIVKTIGTEYKERIVTSVRQKNQITYKSKPIKNSRFFNRKLKCKKGLE